MFIFSSFRRTLFLIKPNVAKEQPYLSLFFRNGIPKYTDTPTPTCFDCFTGKNWGFNPLGDKYDFLRAIGGDSC